MPYYVRWLKGHTAFIPQAASPFRHLLNVVFCIKGLSLLLVVSWDFLIRRRNATLISCVFFLRLITLTLSDALFVFIPPVFIFLNKGYFYGDGGTVCAIPKLPK